MNASRTLWLATILALSMPGCTSAPAVGTDAASADAASADAAEIDALLDDTGASEAGADDAGAALDAGVACTPIAIGAEVTTENVAADIPLPAGGTVSDGTYTLVAIHAYTGAGGATGPGTRTLAGAIRFSGSAYELVLVERGTADGSSGTFTTTDPQIVFERACPAAATTPSIPYGATPSQFELYLPPDLVLTFARS